MPTDERPPETPLTLADWLWRVKRYERRIFVRARNAGMVQTAREAEKKLQAKETEENADGAAPNTHAKPREAEMPSELKNWEAYCHDGICPVFMCPKCDRRSLVWDGVSWVCRASAEPLCGYTSEAKEKERCEKTDAK